MRGRWRGRCRHGFFHAGWFRFRVGHRVRYGRFRDLRGGYLGGLFRHVDLRFGFRFRIGPVESVEPAQLQGHVLVDRAGVGLLFDNAQFREAV
jgi:hypothetical protein